MIDPTLGAVLVCGLFAVLFGWAWYSPAIFGSAWMQLSGMSPEMTERGKKRMPFVAVAMFFAYMLIAYVMSYVSAAWGFYTWQGAVQLGVWIWLGFFVPQTLGLVLWEQKSAKLFFIHAFYWLITLMVMAQIVVFAYGIEISLDPNAGADYGAYGVE